MMKRILFRRDGRSARGGFNLVETCFTLGVVSFAFVTLAPMTGFGLRASAWAREDRLSAQIARTLTEEERQGTLGTSPVYLDAQGAASTPLNAAYIAQPVTQAAGTSASQLALRVTPVGAPGRARIYAVVLPAGAEQ
jgi:hypothetical protein